MPTFLQCVHCSVIYVVYIQVAQSTHMKKCSELSEPQEGMERGFGFLS